MKGNRSCVILRNKKIRTCFEACPTFLPSKTSIRSRTFFSCDGFIGCSNIFDSNGSNAGVCSFGLNKMWLNKLCQWPEDLNSTKLNFRWSEICFCSVVPENFCFCLFFRSVEDTLLRSERKISEIQAFARSLLKESCLAPEQNSCKAATRRWS